MLGIIIQADHSLLSLNNPIVITVIIVIVVITLLFLSLKYIYLPLLQKHQSEKNELMALFAQLDPDPVFRIDKFGVIQDYNCESLNVKSKIRKGNANISEFFPKTDVDIETFIDLSKDVSRITKINDKVYEVTFREVPQYEFIQVYFHDITERKKSEDELIHYSNLQKNFTEKLQNGIDEERDRISKELHDSLLGNLVYLKLILQNQDISEKNEVLNLLRKTINEGRELVHSIRPINLEDLGLTIAIEEAIRLFRESSKIECEFLNNCDLDEKIDKIKELSFLRVIQESLANITKHSKADKCKIKIECDGKKITTQISDNGVGFAPKYLDNGKLISNGTGLMNMQERINKINGNFSLVSDNEKGTMIEINIPIED